jgi:2,4-dienoyl-CoA reductase-like NADH-dependent reductase (Old Yellow Enzyme family)
VAIGDRPWLGCINSTSFWPRSRDRRHSEDRARQRAADTDYVNVRPAHHLHPRRWSSRAAERGYAHKIRDVEEAAPRLAASTARYRGSAARAGDADAICPARQLFTDPYWAKKAEAGA